MSLAYAPVHRQILLTCVSASDVPHFEACRAVGLWGRDVLRCLSFRLPRPFEAFSGFGDELPLWKGKCSSLGASSPFTQCYEKDVPGCGADVGLYAGMKNAMLCAVPSSPCAHGGCIQAPGRVSVPADRSPHDGGRHVGRLGSAIGFLSIPCHDYFE